MKAVRYTASLNKGGFSCNVTASSGRMSCVIRGLEPGERYQISVVGYSPTGQAGQAATGLAWKVPGGSDPEPTEPVEPTPAPTEPVDPVEPTPAPPDPVDPVEPTPAPSDPVDPVEPEPAPSEPVVEESAEPVSGDAG